MKNNQINTGDALFTKTQQNVLGILYGRVDKSYYLNEVFKLANMGKGTVKRELDKLTSAGLLTAKKQGNQTHYQANPNNPIFSELKSIVKKTFGMIEVVKSALNALLPEVNYALIYGSVAKDKERASSDIDLMIVSDTVSYSDMMKALDNAENQLGRRINPTIYNHDEFQHRIENKQSFIIHVLANDIMWIKGSKLFKREFNIEKYGRTG